MKPMRIRYGVLNSDAGRIMDDGTIARLDDETFYVTTTSTAPAPSSSGSSGGTRSGAWTSRSST
jgi:glycine cleavage system aminomethyltransferase T